MADSAAARSPESQRELEKAHKAAVVIGVAMIASVFIYAVIAQLIAIQNAPFEGFVKLNQIAIVRYALYAYAAFQVVCITILRRVLLKKSASDDRGASIRRLHTSTIVTYALCEVPVLLGLILVLLNGLHGDFYLLALLSLLLYLVYFPRYDAWAELI